MKEQAMRVLLVDDQVLFAESLQTVIEIRADDMDVVGIASDGEEAVAMARRLVPDVILMDVRMPKMDGVEATGRILAEFPQIHIMMLTTFDDDKYVREALKHGAVGYMLKNTPAMNLLDGIRALRAGAVLISPAIAARLVSGIGVLKERGKKPAVADSPSMVEKIEFLSMREREVLAYIANGYSNIEIGELMFIAEQTVKNHVGNIYKKLDIHDRVSAVRFADMLQDELGIHD